MMIGILCSELFSLTKIQASLDALGVKYVSIDGPKDAKVDQCEKILVDLTNPLALDVIAKWPEKCVAFGPHMQVERFAEAKERGCRHVLARSAFFMNFKDIVFS